MESGPRTAISGGSPGWDSMRWTAKPLAGLLFGLGLCIWLIMTLWCSCGVRSTGIFAWHDLILRGTQMSLPVVSEKVNLCMPRVSHVHHLCFFHLCDEYFSELVCMDCEILSRNYDREEKPGLI